MFILFAAIALFDLFAAMVPPFDWMSVVCAIFAGLNGAIALSYYQRRTV